jgi:hypothetical protein
MFVSAAPFDTTTKKRIGRLLSKTVTEYLADEKHRREFESWYLEQYGVEYQWKNGGRQ